MDQTYRTYVIVGTAVFVVVAVIILAGVFSSYLGARLSGPDVARLFRPLVRHQISQVHCYDDGSLFCESRKDEYKKEFTIGYIPQSIPRKNEVATETLYSCASPRDNKFFVARGQQEYKQTCRKNYNQTYRLGYIFQQPVIEASTPLYRCTSDTDTLLSDSKVECDAQEGYTKPVLLGYVAGAGYLPQRSLGQLCSLASTYCGTGSMASGFCSQQQLICQNVPSPLP